MATYQQAKVWQAWATTSTSTASDGTWTAWVSDTTSTTASVTVDTTWTTWTTGGYVLQDTTSWPVWIGQVEQKQLARREEKARRKQAAEREAEHRRLQAEAAERARAHQAKLAQARARAEQLLCEHLSDEQERAWRENKAIFVTGKSGRLFKIKDGMSGNIDELDRDGKVIGRFCVHVAKHDCPTPDNVLAQKLALEHDDHRLLAIANRLAV